MSEAIQASFRQLPRGCSHVGPLPNLQAKAGAANVEIRDDTEVVAMRVREVEDASERELLCKLAVAAFPPCEEFKNQTTRRIPGCVAEPS